MTTSDKDKPLLVIPARYASSRLPGKPLVKLAGVPMILRTVERCALAIARQQIIVATDDERVRDVCAGADVRVEMTSKNCLTGTDRVAEIARRFDAPFYVNVQGDEPLFNPDDVRLLISVASRTSDTVFNGYCAIESEAEFLSVKTPKVVFSENGKLLYMSRAPIPGNKERTFRQAWRQVCAYAFTREALAAFTVRQTKTALESVEDIEILRFVEMGYAVQMIAMSNASIPVDYPEDVAKVEAVLARQSDA